MQTREEEMLRDIVLNDYLFDEVPTIYRIVPIGDLIQALISGKFTMVKPQKWERSDPFENFMLHATVIDAHGNEGSFGFRDTVYAQCWSNLSLSDAMWRLYSPNKDGVRIKVLSAELFDTLINSVDEGLRNCCYIGNVVYKHSKELYRIQEELLDQGAYIREPTNIVKTLLYKRMAFKHESEIRLIFHPDVDFGEIFTFDIRPIA